jgi:hypothetical protein
VSGKRIPFGCRPATDPGPESWVRQRDGANKAASSQANVHTARLTIDVTPELRGRIKIAAFRQGVTVADMMRALLEREFPEKETGV